MRFAAAILLLALGACSKEAPMSPDIAQNREMIRETIKAYHEAADKDEIDLIKTLMTPDVSLVLSPSEMIRGQELVLRTLHTRFKDQKGQSTITGKEMIKPDGNTALVTYVASTTQQRGTITMICSRTKDNKWLISHLHETWSTPSK